MYRNGLIMKIGNRIKSINQFESWCYKGGNSVCLLDKQESVVSVHKRKHFIKAPYKTLRNMIEQGRLYEWA